MSGRLHQAYFRASRNTVPLLVIYDRPTDDPTAVVVRLWETDRPTGNAWRFASLEEARAAIPPGLVRFPRASSDDDVIVETWL